MTTTLEILHLILIAPACNAILEYFTDYVTLPLLQLKQLYCNLIYPYISYAIVVWESAFYDKIPPLKNSKHTESFDKDHLLS